MKWAVTTWNQVVIVPLPSSGVNGTDPQRWPKKRDVTIGCTAGLEDSSLPVIVKYLYE